MLQLYDGHSGLGAAKLARDRLLGMVQGHLGEDASRAGFLSQLPKALAQAFEQCNASLPKGAQQHLTET
jgi:serine/threonine protein phosphatase PrpC